MKMKLRITESQLETIISHIQESNQQKEVLEEGWKEVVLGTAMLLGVGLSGANAQTAQNALSNAQILQQIERTLESNKINQLADTLEKSGFQNALEVMQKNAGKLEANFNKAAEKSGTDVRLSFSSKKDVQSIEDKLRQGYAVSDIVIERDTILPEGSTVLAQDTIDLDYSSDAMFVTGSFELTSETTDTLVSKIKGIDSIDGKIVKVYIESSTDKEPIQMGNEKLSQLRAESVQKLLVENGVEGDISIVTKADSGPDMYSRTMSKEQRKEARQETSKYRYVKVKIVVIIPIDVDTPETVPQVMERLEVKLVKARIPSKPPTGTDKSRSKISCKIIKFKQGGSAKCPKF